MAFVEIHDLIKIYKDIEANIEVPALRGIELSIEEGELVGIIGPSGAGKTTLLSIIGGLLFPSSGEVLINGTNLASLTEKELIAYRRDMIGFLWQLSEDNLIPNISILKNVMLPMQLANKPLEEQKKRAKELLERVGLTNRENHKLHQISSGEAQRAGIAVALANEPKLLLGDQVTGELDSKTSRKIIKYLRELNDDFGTTMIIATHKKEFIESTDCSFEILDGRITKVLTRATGEEKEQIATSPQEEFIFVDWRGNLRLPDEILREVKIDGLVKAVVEKGIIKLIPINRSRKDKKKAQKNEEKQ